VPHCSISVKGIPLHCSYSLAPVPPEVDLSAINKIKYLEAGNVFNINVTQIKKLLRKPQETQRNKS
jgi:hypothetical protein